MTVGVTIVFYLVPPGGFLKPAMSAILSFRAPNNTLTRPPARVAFSREELRELLNVYSRRVAAGEWRDYAIDHGPNRAIFSVFRHTADVPVYKVEKIRPRTGRVHYVLYRGCEELRRGPTIAAVVAEIERRPRLVSVR